MEANDSMLELLEKVKTGDEEATQVIWDRFFPQLLKIARRRLPNSAGSLEDEEDVALSVMDSFFAAAKQGRFPALDDHDSVWRLLSEMTRRKVIDRIRKHLAGKQGGGQLRGDSALMVGDSGYIQEPAEDEKLATDLAIVVREQVEGLLEAIREKDTRLEELALAKMEGYTNEELAERFERSVPTIERWLQRIRKIGERIIDD